MALEGPEKQLRPLRLKDGEKLFQKGLLILFRAVSPV